MYFIGGDKDPVNPVAGTKEAYEKIQSIWKANKAEKNLKAELIAGGGHEYLPAQQTASFDWLDAQFK
jgi:hypothetical protein